MRRESALSVDAPVTLDELLDKNARETLSAGARDLGVALAVTDQKGHWLVGSSAPREVAAAMPDLEPLQVQVGGRPWMVCPLYHEGDIIGRVVLGPFPASTASETAVRIATHLTRVTDALLLEGIKRALSARMHMATLEEANRELTEKNKRLAQAVERLQEADRIKSNFLATVSHELRTPLTSVIGYSEMLLEGIAGELNEEQREYVKTVMEKGDQLLQLITGILDISRVEANEMRWSRAPFELSQIVDVALNTVAPTARRRHITVSKDMPPGLPSLVGDRDKIRQVLLNLLNNALKFTPENGRIHIDVRLGQLDPAADPGGAPDAVKVSVSDSGIGIPVEHQKRIFDAFYQVDNSSTREFGGTGLGLNIVKKFIEGHRGHVWVLSQEGKGATFVFTMPLHPESAPLVETSSRPPDSIPET